MSGEVNEYVMQGYLEQCFKRHMNLNETKNTLWLKAKIKPAYTELAWKQLEKANPAFFKAYHYRLLVKDQIVRFNQLLERHVELITGHSIDPTSIHMSNGSHIPPNDKNPTFNGQDYTGSALQAGDMNQPLSLNEGSSSVQPCMQGTVDISNNDRRINTSSNVLMDGNSNILMDGSSNVLMDGNSNILMDGSSNVLMDGNSNMLMDGSSNKLMDGSSNKLMDGSLNKIMDGSSNMLMDGNSNMLMDRSSNKLMDGTSNMLMDGNSTMLMDGSSNKVMDGSSNMLMDRNSNMLMDGSSNKLMDGSSNMLMDGNLNMLMAGSSNKLMDGSSNKLMAGSSNMLMGGSSDMLFHGSSNMGLEQGITVGLDNLLDPQYQIEQQENSRLNKRFKGLNSDNFGSN